MSAGKARCLLFALSLAVCAFAADVPKTLPKIVVPAVPLKFLGGAGILLGSAECECKLGMSGNPWRGGVRISDGMMTIMGNKAEVRDGVFRADFAATPRPGGPIVLTYRGAEPSAPLYTGTVMLPPLIQCSSPASGASVNVSLPGDLTISWSGGTPPYDVSIIQVGGTHVVLVISISRYGGTSLAVPLGKFRAGSRYRLILRDS